MAALGPSKMTVSCLFLAFFTKRVPGLCRTKRVVGILIPIVPRLLLSADQRFLPSAFLGQHSTLSIILRCETIIIFDIGVIEKVKRRSVLYIRLYYVSALYYASMSMHVLRRHYDFPSTPGRSRKSLCHLYLV